MGQKWEAVGSRDRTKAPRFLLGAFATCPVARFQRELLAYARTLKRD
jgi:hypothetical protein